MADFSIADITQGAAVGLDYASKKNAGQAALLKGRRAKTAADFEAVQLEQNAGQAIAASQRAAEDVKTQTKLISSRALALAAASGGGASDPTVMNLIAKTASEGAYRRSVALYQGQERARLMNLQASSRRLEGENAMQDAQVAKKSSDFAATTSLVSGGASLYSRFAGGGPQSASSTPEMFFDP